MCKSLFPAITEIEGDTAQMWVRYMTQIKPKPFLWLFLSVNWLWDP